MAIRARNTGSKSVNILGSEQIIEDEMRTSYVTVIPYSDQWERDFLKIKDEIKSALGELAESIEHVGSTSVRDFPQSLSSISMSLSVTVLC